MQPARKRERRLLPVAEIVCKETGCVNNLDGECIKRVLILERGRGALLICQGYECGHGEEAAS
jgi:hypothetical protein